MLSMPMVKEAIVHRLTRPGLCLSLTYGSMLVTSYENHGSPALLVRDEPTVITTTTTAATEPYLEVAALAKNEMGIRILFPNSPPPSTTTISLGFTEGAVFANLLEDYVRARYMDGMYRLLNFFDWRGSQRMNDETRSFIITQLVKLAVHSWRKSNGGSVFLPDLGNVFLVNPSATGTRDILVYDPCMFFYRELHDEGDDEEVLRFILSHFIDSFTMKWSMNDIEERTQMTYTEPLSTSSPQSCTVKVGNNMEDFEGLQLRDVLQDPTFNLKVDTMRNNVPFIRMEQSLDDNSSTPVKKLRKRRIMSGPKKHVRVPKETLSLGLQFLVRLWVASHMKSGQEREDGGQRNIDVEPVFNVDPSKQMVSPFIFVRVDKPGRQQYEILTPGTISSTNELALAMFVKRRCHLVGCGGDHLTPLSTDMDLWINRKHYVADRHVGGRDFQMLIYIDPEFTTREEMMPMAKDEMHVILGHRKIIPYHEGGGPVVVPLLLSAMVARYMKPTPEVFLRDKYVVYINPDARPLLATVSRWPPMHSERSSSCVARGGVILKL